MQRVRHIFYAEGSLYLLPEKNTGRNGTPAVCYTHLKGVKYCVTQEGMNAFFR
ncbi:MAG: hypothetical protein JWO53_328 [Chlamydiia bacterium]|nr:hypothetical protein [Chlamydiia bacterium]